MSETTLHSDLPSHVAVGSQTYSIEPWYKRNEDDDDGECDYRDCAIRVNHELDRFQQVATVAHELGHIGLARSGLKFIFNADQQEAICEMFGYLFAELEATGFLSLRKDAK